MCLDLFRLYWCFYDGGIVCVVWLWGVVFMEGGRWYSTWSKIGGGGSRARRRVRSMNGGMAMERPRAMSDHVLMKWRDDKPSARV